MLTSSRMFTTGGRGTDRGRADDDTAHHEQLTPPADVGTEPLQMTCPYLLLVCNPLWIGGALGRSTHISVWQRTKVVIDRIDLEGTVIAEVWPWHNVQQTTGASIAKILILRIAAGPNDIKELVPRQSSG